MTGMLSNVTVIELANFVAAPSAARLLADWGANVIKIEPPKGDTLRVLGELVNMPIDNEKENPAFDLQNSNKKGIIINLKTSEGQELLHRLLSSADIFITNSRQQALEKLGLSYEKLSPQYPKLVYGHVLGYGEAGPDRDRPGFDFTAFFARGGISGTLYERGGYPMPTVAAFGDMQVGSCLAGGLCAALYQANKTGKGEKVSVSLMHTAIYHMAHLVTSAQYGNVYPRSRNETANPLQLAYESKDGRWIQCALHAYDYEYPKLCILAGHPELAEDPRYCAFDQIKDSPQEVIAVLDEIFKEKTANAWMDLFKREDMSCDIMMKWDEILEDTQAWEDNILCKVDGYTNDESRIMVRSPVKFREMGLPQYGKGPKLGEHTVEIMKAVGYTPDEVEKMIALGAVKG